MAVAAAASLLVGGAAAASADDASTLTVVGTSDVYDSNLVQSVLKPGFEAAYPQYTLNYVSRGTGAAIAYAEAGTASALVVHAASLENQFVDQGYSAERFGRAIFWGDYVLLGPNGDPLGVAASHPHDIAGAFEQVAAAGAAGNANFVSRGGTPGTTVQEHAIWSLTSGVGTCVVSATNGGGTTPSTAGGSCAGDNSPPSWYHATGLTQGPNIVNADTCNYSGGSCYVLTDRGTYQYLRSTGAATNLKIVARDNGDDARGGQTALVNSFHAYAINPAKFAGNANVSINSAAAKAFLDWTTSPAGQAAVGGFLAEQQDPPFIPDAAPTLTGSAPAASVNAGGTITVTGRASNVVPGTPPLGGQTVTLSTLSPVATAVATTTTKADGTYAISYKPGATAAYAVSTGQIEQIENASLSPVFGDLLAPTSTAVGSTVVQQPASTTTATTPPTTTTTAIPATPPATALADVRLRSVAARKGVLTVRGTLSAKAARTGTKVQLLARKTLRLAKGKRHAARVRQSLRVVKTVRVAKGGRSFTVRRKLARGYRWQVRLRYTSPGTTRTTSSSFRSVRVR